MKIQFTWPLKKIHIMTENLSKAKKVFSSGFHLYHCQTLRTPNLKKIAAKDTHILSKTSICEHFCYFITEGFSKQKMCCDKYSCNLNITGCMDYSHNVTKPFIKYYWRLKYSTLLDTKTKRRRGLKLYYYKTYLNGLSLFYFGKTSLFCMVLY